MVKENTGLLMSSAPFSYTLFSATNCNFEFSGWLSACDHGDQVWWAQHSPVLGKLPKYAVHSAALITWDDTVLSRGGNSSAHPGQAGNIKVWHGFGLMQQESVWNGEQVSSKGGSCYPDLSIADVWEFRTNMPGFTKLSRGPGSLDFYLKSLDFSMLAINSKTKTNMQNKNKETNIYHYSS